MPGCTACATRTLRSASRRCSRSLSSVNGSTNWWKVFRMADHGVAILMSTHTLEVAEEMCDLISIILKGKIIAHGTVAELRALAGSPNEELTPVFLKLTGGSGLQEIEELL